MRRLVWALATVCAAETAAADATPVVVAAGVNASFDQGLAILSFAETDAERFAHVMSSAGGVDPSNSTLLKGPTAEEFVQAVKDRMRTAPQPARLILYFSGHADDRGLHFRHGPLPMAKLRALLADADAPTKVLFVDSCFSGAIAAKGVASAEPFALPRLDTDELSGTVFLTASSARESAYESTELSGSLFTHNVISGLSGGADGNKDGLVTVEELYQFVYRETRLRTMTYPLGQTQHPEFHADLHGQGALVLAKPRATLGKIQVDPGVIGTVRLLSLSGLGNFTIPYGSSPTRTLSVPEGSYRAIIRRGDQLGEASISIVRGGITELRPRQFSWHSIDMEIAAVTKGGGTLAVPMIGMVSLGRSAGGKASIESMDALLSREIVSKSMPVSRWSLHGQVGAFHNAGTISGLKVTSNGASLGLGVVQAWSGVAMRGILGLGMARNWQTLDRGSFIYDKTMADNPTSYIGALFPIANSIMGQMNLSARMVLTPMQDVNGASRDVSQYLFGLEFEP